MASDVYCPMCGHVNRETAAFCRECGVRLAGSPAPAGPATADQPVAAVDPAATQTELGNYARDAADSYPLGFAQSAPDDQAGGFLPIDDGYWPGQGGGRRGWRLTAIGVTVIAVLGAVVLIGWLTSWPAQIFGPSQSKLSAPGPAASAAAPAAKASSPTAGSSPMPSAPGTSAASLGTSAAAGTGPASIVQAYFDAINAHDYAQAWTIVHQSITLTYPQFVSGLNGTAADTVTIVAVNGDNVTVQLQALQTDGTVKQYSGVYTVSGNAIVHADIRQVS